MTPNNIEKEQEKHSGRTFIQDDEIIWESDRWGKLQTIPIGEIKIIGEYTTGGGPLYDDWFFVFVLAPEDIRTISAFAKGAHDLVRSVGHELKTEIRGQLANSSDWRSHVLWPEELKGQELLKIIHKEPRTLWNKLKAKLGVLQREMVLEDEIKDYLIKKASA